MYQELIDNLPNDLLLELYTNICNIVKYQRQHWLNNEKSRTKHFEYLILETRNELNYIIKQMKIKGLKCK